MSLLLPRIVSPVGRLIKILYSELETFSMAALQRELVDFTLPVLILQTCRNTSGRVSKVGTELKGQEAEELKFDSLGVNKSLFSVFFTKTSERWKFADCGHTNVRWEQEEGEQ